MAATIPTQIRIEESTKKQAVELLEGLGLNLSDAVNIFLRQVILQKGIPFAERTTTSYLPAVAFRQNPAAADRLGKL